MSENKIQDYEVINAMQRYGGGFVSQLGHAAALADSDNLRRIKETWADYWAGYTQLVKEMRKETKP